MTKKLIVSVTTNSHWKVSARFLIIIIDEGNSLSVTCDDLDVYL